MPSSNVVRGLLTNFTAGEFSPRIYGRVDYAKYFNAAQKLRNMVVFPHGGVSKRHGMQFIAEARYSNKRSVLKRFTFSDDQEYILEFGDKYVRFYIDGAQIMTNDTTPVPYTLTSIYSEADLHKLRIAQDGDVLYIACRGYKTMKLIRHSHNNWEFVEFVFRNGPFLDMNTTDNKVTFTQYIGSGGLVNSEVYGVFSDSTPLSPTDIGRWIRVDYTMPATLINKGCYDPSSSGVFAGPWNVDGEWEMSGQFYGVNETTRGGSVELQYSVDNGATWGVYDVFRNAVGSTNVIITGVLRSIDYNNVTPMVRLYADGDIMQFIWNFRYKYAEDYAYLELKTYHRVGGPGTTTPSHVFIVKRPIKMLGVPLSDWYLGSFSPAVGYPYAVTFYQDRLFFGGGDSAPQKIYGSKIGEYDNFETGDNDDDALDYAMLADDSNSIRWLMNKSGLVVGTSSSIWLVKDKAARETIIGGENIQPLINEDAVVYVQDKGTRLRSLVYDYMTDRHSAVNLSLLSEHIFEGDRIVAVDNQLLPCSTIFCVLESGRVAVLTLMTAEQVVAWSVFETDGAVESVCCLRDEAWFVVRRTINGQTKRYIERIVPWDESESEMAFMDSWSRYRSTRYAITNITNASPPVVTAPGHNFVAGEMVYISGVLGMDKINRRIFRVQNTTTDTFELFSADTRSYGTYTGGGTAAKAVNAVSGLDYLEGKTVYVTYDGVVSPKKVVANGTISLEEGEYGSDIKVGLPYAPVIETMNLELPIEGGTIQALIKRVVKAIIRLYKSSAFMAGADETRLERVSLRTSGGESGGVYPELFSGDVTVNIPSGFDANRYVYITQDAPLPLTITMIIAEMEIE